MELFDTTILLCIKLLEVEELAMLISEDLNTTVMRSVEAPSIFADSKVPALTSRMERVLSNLEGVATILSILSRRLNRELASK